MDAIPTTLAGEVLKKSGKRKRWPNRYRVTATFNNPDRPYKSVPFLLFRPDMDDEEVADVLESGGLDRLADRFRREGGPKLPPSWSSAKSQVTDTFDAQQTRALVEFFSEDEAWEVTIQPALKPRTRIAGVGGLPEAVFVLPVFHPPSLGSDLVVDCGSSFVCRFSEAEGYPLEFGLAGYTDVRCWELIPVKL